MYYLIVSRQNALNILSNLDIDLLAVTSDALYQMEVARRDIEKHGQVIHVENELKNLYGTRVNIKEKGKKGTIELEYYSTDELNRLIELLKSVVQ